MPRYHLRFPLIADPAGAIFSQYGLRRIGPKQALNSLRPSVLKQGLQALRFGVGLPEKVLLSPPAAFAIAQGGRVAQVHLGRSITESLPMETLLATLRPEGVPKPKSR